MAVYDRLNEMLAPIKIYDSEATVLSWELKAYAAELELLYDDLSAMFRERFITTAEDEGLYAYEKLFGPERTEESVSDRRAMLLLRLNLGNGDFTLSGIRKALDSLGLNYIISEYPQIGKLTVAATTEYTPAQQEWISREVAKIIPPHIEFQLTFNTLTWTQWDALDRTFASVDSADETWHQIDRRTE